MINILFYGKPKNIIFIIKGKERKISTFRVVENKFMFELIKPEDGNKNSEPFIPTHNSGI